MAKHIDGRAQYKSIAHNAKEVLQKHFKKEKKRGSIKTFSPSQVARLPKTSFFK